MKFYFAGFQRQEHFDHLERIEDDWKHIEHVSVAAADNHHEFLCNPYPPPPPNPFPIASLRNQSKELMCVVNLYDTFTLAKCFWASRQCIGTFCLFQMLHSIVSMVDRCKRALAVLQERSIHDREELAAWMRRHSDSMDTDMKKHTSDLVTTTLRHTEDRVSEVKRRAGEDPGVPDTCFFMLYARNLPKDD